MPWVAGQPDARAEDGADDATVLRLRAHAAFWDAVGRSLKHREVERLRALPGIDDAIDALLRDWDGKGDRLEVAVNGTGLVVSATMAGTVCDGPAAPVESGMRPAIESGDPTGPADRTRCRNIPDPVGTRVLELARGIWSRPERDQKSTVSPPELTPTTSPPPERPPIGTLMRIRFGGKAWQVVRTFLSDDLETRHGIWRETVAATPWRDPLLPRSALAAAEALAPLPAPDAPPVSPGLENLRNPFDDSRMQTAWPVAPMVTQGAALPNTPGALAWSPPPFTERCRAETEDTARLDTPPTLDCFRAATAHNRLVFNKLPGPVSMLLQALALPGFNEARMAATADAMASEAWRMGWAASWLHWVDARRAQIETALAGLTAEERRTVRRFVGRWWARREHRDFLPLIDVLVARHFTGLYPEALDGERLPRRDFFDDPWLWTGNWLAAAVRLPASEREARAARALDAMALADIGHLRSRLRAEVAGDGVPVALRSLIEAIPVE
jgi:hypothetical protein